MQYLIALVVIFAVAVAGLGTYADRKDRERTRISTCVLSVATAEGYPGDPNSPEAWQLFAPACSR